MMFVRRSDSEFLITSPIVSAHARGNEGGLNLLTAQLHWSSSFACWRVSCVVILKTSADQDLLSLGCQFLVPGFQLGALQELVGTRDFPLALPISGSAIPPGSAERLTRD